MIPQYIQNQLGILLTLALTVAFQDLVRVPNDRGGVGASGKIGRGTGSGEHFIPRAAPTQYVPAWAYSSPEIPAPSPPARAYSTPEMPAQTSPAQGNVNPSEGVDVAVRLPALTRGHPYLAYHRGWVNGYWNARIDHAWVRPTSGPGGPGAASWRGPVPGLGMGLGWGLSAWLMGPMAYRWGYFPYDNPFGRGGASLAADRPRVDDYSRPISILNPPPTEKLLNEALTAFRSAREAFRREDYPRALYLTDEALRLMPDDPMIHQFRALALFALRRYEESAAALYAVLAVGPGWDWATMIDLYGDRESYTRQLRYLEGYSDDNPRAVAARFVRAYHYLTTGYADEALGQWNHVVALRPDERLSMQLIQELQPSRPGSGDRDAADATVSDPTSSAGAAGSSSRSGKLEGTWIALPRPNTTISLTFQPQGHLVWKVNQPGRDRGFEGYAIYEKRTLILSQDEDNILVGTVRWQDKGHFTFKALADRPGDPGLEFAKAP